MGRLPPVRFKTPDIGKQRFRRNNGRARSREQAVVAVSVLVRQKLTYIQTVAAIKLLTATRRHLQGGMRQGIEIVEKAKTAFRIFGPTAISGD
jgi:hypothetical protein